MQIRAILALVLFFSLYTGKAVFPSVIYKQFRYLVATHFEMTGANPLY